MSSTLGSEATTQARCAHAGCTCVVMVSEAVIAGGRFFCAASCAAGKGCDHRECDCSAAHADDDGA